MKLFNGNNRADDDTRETIKENQLNTQLARADDHPREPEMPYRDEN